MRGGMGHFTPNWLTRSLPGLHQEQHSDEVRENGVATLRRRELLLIQACLGISPRKYNVQGVSDYMTPLVCKFYMILN